jgi:hypothetical protein
MNHRLNYTLDIATIVFVCIVLFASSLDAGSTAGAFVAALTAFFSAVSYGLRMYTLRLREAKGLER